MISKLKICGAVTAPSLNVTVSWTVPTNELELGVPEHIHFVAVSLHKAQIETGDKVIDHVIGLPSGSIAHDFKNE